MIWQVTVVFAFLPLIGQGLERGERCTNQWGEKATCTNIYSCQAAMDAVAASNGSKLFATGIVCGFDTEPLVCCRISSDFDETSINNEVPSDPIIQISTTESADLNISNNNSSFNESVQVVLELLNNNGESEDKEDSVSTTTSLNGVIYTSPPIKGPVDSSTTVASSSVPPPTTITTTTTTTEVPNPLILQTNDTSEAPNPDEPSSSTAPSTSFNVITESSVIKDVPSRVNIDQILPDRTMCGFQYKRDRLEHAPIATIDEFPWMVLLRYQDSFGYDVGFKCVGTLINNRFVITSAHCVANGPDMFRLKSVRLGEWSISSPSDCVPGRKGMECPDKVIDIGVEKKILHPNSNNNIALIRLERKVEFTDFVRPICLPVEHLQVPPVRTILTSSGWGASKSGCLLDIKSKIHLPILSKQQCSHNFFWFKDVPQDQVCVDAFARNDVCKTDSGGPLMLTEDHDNPQWYLEGIIPESFYCDHSGFLGVYTRVTKYIPWIVFTLGQDDA